MKGIAGIAMIAVSAAVMAVPTFEWVRTYTGAATGFSGGVNDILTDATGNVYTISNSLNGTVGFEQFDIVVKKFSPTGTELWSTTVDGAFDVFAYDGEIDASGNIYIAGLESQDDTFLTTRPMCVKINASGGIVFQATHTATNPSDYYGYGVALDGSGGAWIAGEAEEGGAEYNAGLYRVTSGGSMSLVRNIGTDDVYEFSDSVIKLGNDVVATSFIKGSGGVNDFDARVERFDSGNSLVWSATYNSGIGESNDEAFDIATDGTNCYVAIRSARGVSGTTITNSFTVIRKLSASGASLYTTELGVGATHIATSQTLDANVAGEVFVASQSSPTGTANSFNIQVNKLSAAGSVVGSQVYNNAANVNDEVADSKLDASGKYVVAGWVRLSAADRDMILLGYTSALVSDYALQYNNSSFNDWDVARALAIAPGAIYVGGYSDDLSTRYSTVLRYKTGETVTANAFNIITGIPFGGGVPELQASDDASAFILNAEDDPNGEAEILSTTTVSTPTSLKLTFEASASRDDLSQFVELFRYSNSTWQLGSLTTTTLSDSTVVYTATNPAQFVGPAGALKARVRYIPQADLEVADGWAEAIDFVKWELE